MIETNKVNPSRSAIAAILVRVVRRMDGAMAEALQAAIGKPPDAVRANYDAELQHVLVREDERRLGVVIHAQRLLNGQSYRDMCKAHVVIAEKLGITGETSDAMLHARLYLAGRYDGRRREAAIADSAMSASADDAITQPVMACSNASSPRQPAALLSTHTETTT